jgi:hypothetical protein
LDGKLKKKCLEELREAGFTNLQTFNYDALEYYQTPEDLLLLLIYTPIIPDFGLNDRDFELLNNFIANNQTSKGIVTNSNRFMIIPRK